MDPPLPSEGESQNSFIKLTHLLSGRNQYLPCLFVKLYISTASIYWCGQPSVELSAIFLNGCLKGAVRKFSFPRHQTAAGWGIMIHQPDQNSEWFKLAFQNRNASAPDHHNEWHLSTTCLLRLGLAFLPTQVFVSIMPIASVFSYWDSLSFLICHLFLHCSESQFFTNTFLCRKKKLKKSNCLPEIIFFLDSHNLKGVIPFGGVI